MTTQAWIDIVNSRNKYESDFRYLLDLIASMPNNIRTTRIEVTARVYDGMTLTIEIVIPDTHR